MSRLYSGFLLREIVERFKMKIEEVLKPNRTLWLYSAHDETLTGDRRASMKIWINFF